MKKRQSFFIIIFLVSIFSISIFADSKDTLVVHASGKSLDVIINNDQASTTPHSVYKLVSTDTTYIFLDPITIKTNVTVIGVLGKNKRPPTIQPAVRTDGSMSTFLFILAGDNTISKFRNLYLIGLTTLNTRYSNSNGEGALINVTGKHAKLYVDNVIFDEWPDNQISYEGDWCSFFITNCKFRNGIHPTQWYSGEALRNRYNTAFTDSIIMKNNTIFAINAYASCPVTANYINYFEFVHNSVIMTFMNPFWVFNATKAKINNNLFYGTWAGGETDDEFKGYWNQLWSLDRGSIIDFDTLSVDNAKYLDPNATTKPAWTAEAKRVIEVKNNNFYMPKVVFNYLNAWNDTSKHPVNIPKFMNDRTKKMFTDKTHWPGFTESGNLLLDPTFGPSIDKIVEDNQGNGIGLAKYFLAIRTNTANTGIYGYKIQSVTGDNWVPNWPLPEITDMQYKNSSLLNGGTDGKPIGDPGWFTGGYTGISDEYSQLPSGFQLNQNYPNPFNPTTQISYSIPKSGIVNLRVYNIIGKEVAELINEYQNSGTYQITFNAQDLPSGVYFYQLKTGDYISSKKMLLIK
ncbi:T9SS type A sorting domain-containing protein [Stygiobacter electus]|uniref:T9SS type A sorting domain-containing protein n=1 Tax=Stygiobacter electus TaxID=3032292 RepID=A0AAE3NV55_9BACT|nr:T9SS type A sorting domain-containing protein [Stygiobacter electus]MDF1610641.1 T9SS type A sorting domain-containing protein [Stygiobacter electus]